MVIISKKAKDTLLEFYNEKIKNKEAFAVYYFLNTVVFAVVTILTPISTFI